MIRIASVFSCGRLSGGLHRQQGWLQWPLLLYLLAMLPLLPAYSQWQRGQQRQQQLAHYDQMLRQPPQLLAALVSGSEPVGQRVWLRVRGSSRAIHISNAVFDGKAGVRVWQPVQIGDGSWVVVDRGWLPGPAAYIQLPLTNVVLQGYWLPRPQPHLQSGARIADSGEVDALDWAALARRLPGHLHPGLVVLENTLQPLQPWPTRPLFNPQRHYAYAVQWLLLSLCLIGGVWAWQWQRMKIRTARPSGAD